MNDTVGDSVNDSVLDAELLEMLRSSLTKVLTEGSSVALAVRLAELGWDDVVANDAPSALQALFEISGETLSGADPLSPLLARSLADSLGAPDLASAALVLPATLHPQQLTSSVDGTSIVVSGVLLGPAPAGSTLLVPVDRGDGAFGVAHVHAFDAIATAIEAASPVEAVLHESGQHPLRVETTVALSDAAVFDGPHAQAAWETAVALGRWTSAAELVGIGMRVLATAVAYAGERTQYGRAIGSFQALQHRIAGAHTLIVGARHVVDEAARRNDPWVALVAKAAAGRAAELACTQAQQTYGAIGFTWEHEFHRYLRRVYLVDRRLGDWRSLEFEIGSRIQATGRAPRIGVL